MSISRRDLALLRFIVEREAVPASVLATSFFATHGRTGAANRDPLHACRRRLKELEADGWIVQHGDSQRFVTVAAAGARRLGCEKGRAPSLKNATHHAETVRAVERVLLALGAPSTARVRMESAVRKERIGGRFVKLGLELGTLPDAEIEIAERGGSSRRIAVEYVSAKYSDDQIRAKAAGLRHFDDVFFFADTAATAKRVMRLTNRGCQCT